MHTNTNELHVLKAPLTLCNVYDLFYWNIQKPLEHCYILLYILTNVLVVIDITHPWFPIWLHRKQGNTKDTLLWYVTWSQLEELEVVDCGVIQALLISSLIINCFLYCLDSFLPYLPHTTMMKPFENFTWPMNRISARVP